MGALVARLFDYFKKRSSDSQEIEVKQSYWDRLPLEIQRHILQLARLPPYPYQVIEKLRFRFLLESQFRSLTDLKGRVVYQRFKFLKTCPNSVLDDCSFNRKCEGSLCTTNHTLIFVRLPCDAKFLLGNNFKEAFLEF